MKSWIGILALILISSTDRVMSSPLRVITHPEVHQQDVSLNRLRSIFGMRHRKWDDGTLIRVFVLDEKHEVHTRFCTDTLNILPHQLQRAWSRLVFSGTGQAPTRLSTQQEMLERVANTPGAIGYTLTDNGSPEVRMLQLK